MKKLIALLLCLALLIPMWMIGVSASGIDDNLVLHYDFEGADKTEAYYNKADNDGTTVETGALTASTAEVTWDGNAGTIEDTDAGSKNGPYANKDFLTPYVSGSSVEFSIFMRLKFNTGVAAATSAWIQYKVFNMHANAGKTICISFYDNKSGATDFFMVLINGVEYRFSGITFEDLQATYVNATVVVYKDGENYYVKMYASKGQPSGIEEWTQLTCTKNNGTSFGTSIPTPSMNGFLLAAATPAGILMDDFRIYNKALSLAEIHSIMETGSFAPDIVLNIGVQRSDIADNRYNVRFVGGINSFDYDEVGIEITATHGETTAATPTERTATTVYSSIMAGGDEVTASSQHCKYFTAFVVTGIPSNGTEAISFEYRFFAVKDGVKYYSESGVVSFNADGSLSS